MMKRAFVLAVLPALVLMGPTSGVSADEKRKEELALTRKALTVARELTRAVAESKIAEAIEAHVDAGGMVEAMFGEDLARLSKAERDEAEVLLREVLEPVLGRGLATTPPARTSHADASLPAGGRVTITVTIPREGKEPRTTRLMLAKRDGAMRVVEVGAPGIVASMRATYRQGPSRGVWAPLAFLWKLVPPKRAAARLPEPLWRAQLPKPNPAWLSRETLSLGIEPPSLAGAALDRPAATEGQPRWLVVSLDAEGVARFRPGSRFGPLQAFRLQSEDPGKQDDAIQGLIALLRSATNDVTLRNADGSSRRRALIYADRRVPWKYVVWIMQAFAHHSVRVSRISFGVHRLEARRAARLAEEGRASPFGRLDIVLPKDLPARSPFPPPEPTRIKLFRRNAADAAKAYTIVKIDSNKRTYSFPRGWLGWLRDSESRVGSYARTREAILEAVRLKRSEGLAECVEIVTPPPKGGRVPHEDIIGILHSLQRLGVRTIDFEGHATPLTVRERAARRK